LANDYHWRSTKAKKQLRDRFGRWISLGAKVRYRGDGAEQSGTVTSVVDGKAYIDQKNRDGSVTQKILPASSIRVLASKATLPADGKKIKADKFAAGLKSDDFKSALGKYGEATIERKDGYSLAASYESNEFEDEAQGQGNEIKDGSEPTVDERERERKPSSPVVYQLFAPAGRSLGKYGEEAEGDFDDMVDEEIFGNAERADGPVPGTGPGPGGPVQTAPVVTASAERPFRVPEAVKTEIASTISSLSTELPAADLAIATRLANDSTVSLSDVQWVHRFFAENDLSERLRGGFKGRKWASKIVEPTFSIREDYDDGQSDFGHPKYTFDDDVMAYFAVGKDSGSSLVHSLIAVDYETGLVFSWGPEGFTVNEGIEIQEVDEPQLVPIDEMTADSLAKWIDSSAGEDYDLLDSVPEERNLFTMAAPEIDYEELDRTFSIIAAGQVGDGEYTPVERSQNAKQQRRAAGGKFGETPDQPEAPAEAPSVMKARLPVALPLVPNAAARINEWLATAAEAPVVAAAEPAEAPAEESPDPEYTAEDQAVEDAATGPTDEALYFAVVDEVDKTAVMDAIAIVKAGGAPSAYIRSQMTWQASPDTLTILQGSTPPPVVELDIPEPVKTVLSQIDAHDQGKDTTPEPSAADAPKEGEVAVTAAGFSMSDGSYAIIDSVSLKEAVVASAGTSDILVKAHIRKRARALNRMDLVPASWREFSLAEIGEISAAETVYGEFGEIIVAAGIPGIADTPSDFKNVARLKAYWKHGKGALKIRWGTPGDLTRAHRHLAKYVGVQRAWGLAQRLHQELFGVSNITHDRATGQYVPRRKK
jgi:hypothetical protein